MVNKNNSFVLHELLLLICLWLSGQGTKSQMQYRSVFTENFQQSEIKMNHWYCMNLHVQCICFNYFYLYPELTHTGGLMQKWLSA